MRDAIPRATNSRASARNVQRAWPAGGADWANCRSCASPAPSSRRDRGALGWRASAAAGPLSTAWRRQRLTLRADTSRAAAIASSGQPSPAGPSSHSNRARARSIFHPGGRWRPQRPLAIRCSHCRSEAVRRNTYFRDMGKPRRVGWIMGSVL